MDEMTAWMIRNDGKAIPVVQHIYANKEDEFETLYAAEWLYKNTSHPEIKKLVVDFVCSWGFSLMENLIDNEPYVFLTKAFLREISGEVFGAIEQYEGNKRLEDLAVRIDAELNQEFLRARYGGLYNTVAGSKEMVFRISSLGFDWHPVILKFLKDTPFEVETVTIVRDNEATGATDAYYRTSDRENIYHNFPIDDFYEEVKNSKRELKHLYFHITDSADTHEHIIVSLVELLASGKSLSFIHNSFQNDFQRIKDILKKLTSKEKCLAEGKF